MLSLLGDTYLGTPRHMAASSFTELLELNTFCTQRDIAEACQVLEVGSFHQFDAVFSLGSSSLRNKDALAIISDTSLQFAPFAYCGQSSEYYEEAYFFILFITRFIPFLYYEPVRHNCGEQTQRLYHMVLATFLRWLDSILYNYVRYFIQTERQCKPWVFHDRLAIVGLLIQYVKHCLFIFLF